MPDSPNDLHVTNTRGFFENCEFDFCTIFCLCHVFGPFVTRCNHGGRVQAKAPVRCIKTPLVPS